MVPRLLLTYSFSCLTDTDDRLARTRAAVQSIVSVGKAAQSRSVKGQVAVVDFQCQDRQTRLIDLTARSAVKHPQYSPGDACPDCGQGTLYEKSPGVLVRFVGRSPLHATVYRMQKLRCHLCGTLFTAPTPGEIGDDKYEHTVSRMIGLLKYGSGFPFNRLDRLQESCEIPLAARHRLLIQNEGSCC